MSLTKDEVSKIARLARLDISDEDILQYAAELSKILDLAAEMDAVDTSGITPMAHPLGATQRLRKDRVTEENQRALCQAAAPLVENDLYLVPRVIDD